MNKSVSDSNICGDKCIGDTSNSVEPSKMDGNDKIVESLSTLSLCVGTGNETEQDSLAPVISSKNDSDILLTGKEATANLNVLPTTPEISARQALFEAVHAVHPPGTTPILPRRSELRTAMQQYPSEPTSFYILQYLMSFIPKDDFKRTERMNTVDPDCICNVWASNLQQSFYHIRTLLKNYSFIAMDTEFPGIYCKYQFETAIPPNHYNYKEIRDSVDCTKLIQLGLTIMDAHGNVPPGVSTWQFNFHFSLLKDRFASESMVMLINAGLDFLKHEEYGIDAMIFGYYMLSSGLVLNSVNGIKVTWLTFHSGYDFAFLTNILSGDKMPVNDVCFIQLIRTYFPHVFDVKYLMVHCPGLYGGLKDIANKFGVTRCGIQHQAGSDSLLTGKVFFRMKRIFFDGVDLDVYNGCLYGFRACYAGALNFHGLPNPGEYWRYENYFKFADLKPSGLEGSDTMLPVSIYKSLPCSADIRTPGINSETVNSTSTIKPKEEESNLTHI